jgi:2-enoate reductase
VTLFERRDRAGGMLIPGSLPRTKFDVANYRAYLEDHLHRASRLHRLELRFGIEATAGLLGDGGYDAVVLCTGGKPSAPPVEGIGMDQVVQAVDLLSDPSLAGDARRAVVAGGGDVGCETAHWLACELGMQVTIVEMLPYFMKTSCTANRGYLILHLEKAGVTLWNCARLERVEAGRVIVSRNISQTVPSPTVTWIPVLPDNVENPLARPIRVKEQVFTLETDLVVLATGLKPDDSLYRACLAGHVAPELHNSGDAFMPATIAQAVKAGYAVGSSL